MVHDSASAGYSRRADTYQHARPSYHPDLIDRFVRRYAREPVVDVGAGTGTFTSQLAAAPMTLIAIEPVAEMRTLLSARLPSAGVVAGVAEKLPLRDGCAGALVAAQAFHWFEPRAALDEVHRVLRPGAFLVTVWNVRDTGVEWMNRYERIIAAYGEGTPRHSSLEWRAAIERDVRFALVDDWGIDNPQRASAEGVVGRALSTSFIAALPSQDQDGVAADIRRVLPPGDTLVIPYRSELQAWQKV